MRTIKMKKISRIALFLGVLSIIGCGNTSSTEAQNSNVTISGKLDNSSGKQLILMRFANNQAVMLDTVVFSTSGDFELKLNVPQTDFYQLAASQQNSAIFILSPGEHIQISGDANKMRAGLKIKGSENTELLWSFYEVAQEYGIKNQELRQKINALPADQEAEKQKLIDEFNEMNQSFNDYAKQFIDDHSESPAALSVLGSLNKETDLDYFVKVRDGLKSSFSFSPYYKDLNNKIESQKAQQSKAKMFAPGNEVPNITLNDPYGNSRSLSSLRGNVVLIDFWASWCRPCRAENPNVVKLYNKYNKDGFEVFSVSLDKTKDRWIQAIEADGLVWKNHVSDLKYWQSAAAKQYNVTSIPFTVLIDREGKVIATKLRGPSLEAKLREIFGY